MASDRCVRASGRHSKEVWHWRCRPFRGACSRRRRITHWWAKTWGRTIPSGRRAPCPTWRRASCLRRGPCARCWWLASTHTCLWSARHSRSGSPLPAVSFDLFELSLAISAGEVGYTANEQADVIVRAVESIGAAKGPARWAVRPSPVGRSAVVSSASIRGVSGTYIRGLPLTQLCHMSWRQYHQYRS